MRDLIDKLTRSALFRRIFALAGAAALVLVAVGIDLLRFGRWYGLGPRQTALLLFGLALFVLAAAVPTPAWTDWRHFGRSLMALYRGLGLLLLNTLLLLLLVEGAAYLLLRLTAEESPALSAAVETAEWQDVYNQEHLLSGRQQYEPFVLWRSQPFAGQTINIDDAGRRVTPDSDCLDGNAVLVMTFGGSTMWGHGSPDWETIPAFLQQQFGGNMATAICVQNYGERGYVSSQGVISLMQALQQGVRPDLVIFYDGGNDVAAAVPPGRPGAHLSLAEIQTQFEQPWLALLADSSSYRLIQQLSGRPAVSDTDALAGDVAAAYLANYEAVAGLAERYHFEFHFFWQPIIFAGRKPLTPVEQQIVDGFEPELAALYHQSYELIEAESAEREQLHYLGDLFNEYSEPIYLDLVHTNGRGNELVAEAIFTTITASEPAITISN